VDEVKCTSVALALVLSAPSDTSACVLFAADAGTAPEKITRERQAKAMTPSVLPRVSGRVWNGFRERENGKFTTAVSVAMLILQIT
jgi:hypothetical protein